MNFIPRVANSVAKCTRRILKFDDSPNSKSSSSFFNLLLQASDDNSF
eukprot:UN19414